MFFSPSSHHSPHERANCSGTFLLYTSYRISTTVALMMHSLLSRSRSLKYRIVLKSVTVPHQLCSKRLHSSNLPSSMHCAHSALKKSHSQSFPASVQRLVPSSLSTSILFSPFSGVVYRRHPHPSASRTTARGGKNFMMYTNVIYSPSSFPSATRQSSNSTFAIISPSLFHPHLSSAQI